MTGRSAKPRVMTMIIMVVSRVCLPLATAGYGHAPPGHRSHAGAGDAGWSRTLMSIERPPPKSAGGLVVTQPRCHKWQEPFACFSVFGLFWPFSPLSPFCGHLYMPFLAGLEGIQAVFIFSAFFGSFNLWRTLRSMASPNGCDTPSPGVQPLPG